MMLMKNFNRHWVAIGIALLASVSAVALEEDKSLVVITEFKPLTHTAVRFSGLSGLYPFDVVLTKDQKHQQQLSIAISSRKWELDGSDGVLPNDIDFASLRVASYEPAILRLMFYYGLDKPNCDSNVNGRYLSYGVLDVMSEGLYQISYYEIQDSCEIKQYDVKGHLREKGD